MSVERPRYSQLEPLGVQERLRLSKLAVQFFSPMSYRSMCQLIGKAEDERQTRPLDGRDFLSYLSKTMKLADPDRYVFRIQELLAQLASRSVLTEMGAGRDPLIGKHYYFLRELTKREREGWLWLAPVLGPEFVQDSYANVTLQITGITASGDVHAGTGVAIAPRWILTCAHVVTDMRIDEKQAFAEKEFSVIRVLPHREIDVALIEVDRDLPQLPGIAFRDPTIAETVYTLGYPRIPLSRKASLVMQRGEITAQKLVTLSRREVFLYSAIARPGNSGGPVIADTGHIVGIVTEELSQETSRPDSPFHAGIRTSVISKAIADIESSVVLPMETYE